MVVRVGVRRQLSRRGKRVNLDSIVADSDVSALVVNPRASVEVLNAVTFHRE
jgi:hypothetical protein